MSDGRLFGSVTNGFNSAFVEATILEMMGRVTLWADVDIERTRRRREFDIFEENTEFNCGT